MKASDMIKGQLYHTPSLGVFELKCASKDYMIIGPQNEKQENLYNSIACDEDVVIVNPFLYVAEILPEEHRLNQYFSCRKTLKDIQSLGKNYPDQTEMINSSISSHISYLKNCFKHYSYFTIDTPHFAITVAEQQED